MNYIRFLFFAAALASSKAHADDLPLDRIVGAVDPASRASPYSMNPLEQDPFGLATRVSPEAFPPPPHYLNSVASEMTDSLSENCGKRSYSKVARQGGGCAPLYPALGVARS